MMKMNEQASRIPTGSDGLCIIPFGNGAERMFENKVVGAHLNNIDLNKHSKAHVFRAVQEGIAFAFRYGMDIMRENGCTKICARGHVQYVFERCICRVICKCNWCSSRVV